MTEIVVNGRFLSRRATGVDRFAREILRAIDAMLVENDPRIAGLSFEVLAPDEAEPDSRFSRIGVRRVGRFGGYAWEQIVLPIAARGRPILNLCNTAPLLVRRQAVVIHDAATARVPEAFTPRFRRAYAMLMPALGRRARCVLTVSEFSRRELESCWGIDRRRVAVIGEGAEHVLRGPPDRSALERHGLEPGSYLLAVGSLVPHKDFATLLRAFASPIPLPVPLAVAGGADPRVFRDAGLMAPDGTRWLGYVDDAALRALYEGALAFVFPSRYEGFGLPPVEAMACGCPVVASSAASLPEVCGDAACYFETGDSAALRQVLERVIADGALRATLRHAGLRRAAQLSWRRAARELLLQVRNLTGTGLHPVPAGARAVRMRQ